MSKEKGSRYESPTALFFLAFLPQFVALGEPMVPQLVMLGSVCVALNTLVDVGAVLAADRLLESGPAERRARPSAHPLA